MAVIVFVIFCVIAGVALYRASNSRKSEVAEQTKASKEYLRALINGKTPEVKTALLLEPNEKVFLNEEGVKLYEGRASRIGAGVGTRIGRLYVGKSESHSKNALVEIDEGELTITSHRLVFSGQLEQRTIHVKDVQELGSFSDYFSVASAKRNKKSLFRVENPILWQVLIRNAANGKIEKAFVEGITEDGTCPDCGGSVEDQGNGKGVCQGCGSELDETTVPKSGQRICPKCSKAISEGAEFHQECFG